MKKFDRREVIGGIAVGLGIAALPQQSLSQTQSDWNKVIEAAKKEGKLVVYTAATGQPAHVAIGRAFEKKYGITLGGNPGSGKSTIASLLLRFYDVTKGSLVIDGVDIRDHDLERLRNQLSIV